MGETLDGADEQLLRMYRGLKDLSDPDRALIEDMIASMKKRKAEGNAA